MEDFANSRTYGSLTFLFGQVFLDPRVVDAQELVGPGGHVDVEGLSLRTLLVQELVDRLVLRRQAQIRGHDLKQRFPQMR